MKLTYLLLGVLAAGLLAVDGCKKEAKPEMKVEGGVIDMQKIYDLSHGSSQDVQNTVAKLQNDIRYGQYVQALADLDKIVSDPSLSPAQKKEAEDLINQVKQLAQKAPAQ